MRIAIASFLLLAAGRLIWSCLGPVLRTPATPAAQTRARSSVPEDSFCALLSAFAWYSIGLFLLAHLGWLSVGSMACVAAAGAAACLLSCWRRGTVRSVLEGLRRDLPIGAALVALVVVLGGLFPPIDTTLSASDSTVYLATARHLASAGSIRHHDDLVARMTAEERDVLFRNRFPGDHTGTHARFPGGVLLLSPSSDVVSFYFYHLLPIWLAAGIDTLGGGAYLGLLSLFAATALLSMFFIGRQLGGSILGISLCLVAACFQPQAFYSRLPASELLAQALFLSGLFAFIRGLDAADADRQPHLRLASVLWGALCLCRVDAIPFLWLGLTVVSLLPRRLAVRQEDWALPLAATTLFAALAVYHQLAHGIDYVGAFSPGSVSARVGLYLANRGSTDLVILPVFGVGGAVLWRAGSAARWNGRTLLAARAFGLVVSTITMARFLAALDWSGVKTHLRWVEMYTTPLVLATLAAGVLLAVSSAIRRPSRAGAAVMVILAGPLACYLIDPMTVGHQPFVIRRFVPIVFPLFFIVALRGWQSGLGRLFHARPRAAGGAFLLLVAGVAAGLLTAPAGLMARPVGGAAAAEVRRLANDIPGDALVLISDEDAGLHLQLGLAYTCNRDVLVLPLRRTPDERLASVMNGFLDRQLAGGRRVFLVLPRGSDDVRALAGRFRIEPRTGTTLSYETIPFVATDVLPGPPFRASIPTLLVELRPR